MTRARRYVVLVGALAVALALLVPVLGASHHKPTLAQERVRAATVTPKVTLAVDDTRPITLDAYRAAAHDAHVALVSAVDPYGVWCYSNSAHVDYNDPTFGNRWARMTQTIDYCTIAARPIGSGGYVLSANGIFAQPPLAILNGSVTAWADGVWSWGGEHSHYQGYVISPWLMSSTRLPYSAFRSWMQGEFNLCLPAFLSGACSKVLPVLDANDVEFFGGVDKWNKSK